MTVHKMKLLMSMNEGSHNKIFLQLFLFFIYSNLVVYNFYALRDISIVFHILLLLCL